MQAAGKFVERIARGLWRRARALAGRDPMESYLQSWARLSEEDRRFLSRAFDDSVPLPPGAPEHLRADHPQLVTLRQRYAALDLPVVRQSIYWAPSTVSTWLSLQYFRGDSPYSWSYRELYRTTRLKYYVFLKYIAARDPDGLVARLGEDGAFGCWSFQYPGHPTVSRDLLDSVNEILFLERVAGLRSRPGLRILDVGAGYGRLAHRVVQAAPHVGDYCCVDAVPESTFLCDYYLRFRSCAPPARVVPLDQVAKLQPGAFDVAVNLHSFSECSYQAVAWWLGELSRLRVPHLLLIPNHGRQLLTTEPDQSQRDFAPLLEQVGYRLELCEPTFADPAVRELLKVDDHFHWYRRAG